MSSDRMSQLLRSQMATSQRIEQLSSIISRMNELARNVRTTVEKLSKTIPERQPSPTSPVVAPRQAIASSSDFERCANSLRDQLVETNKFAAFRRAAALNVQSYERNNAAVPIADFYSSNPLPALQCLSAAALDYYLATIAEKINAQIKSRLENFDLSYRVYKEIEKARVRLLGEQEEEEELSPYKLRQLRVKTYVELFGPEGYKNGKRFIAVIPKSVDDLKLRPNESRKLQFRQLSVDKASIILIPLSHNRMVLVDMNLRKIYLVSDDATLADDKDLIPSVNEALNRLAMYYNGRPPSTDDPFVFTLNEEEPYVVEYKLARSVEGPSAEPITFTATNEPSLPKQPVMERCYSALAVLAKQIFNNELDRDLLLDKYNSIEHPLTIEDERVDLTRASLEVYREILKDLKERQRVKRASVYTSNGERLVKNCARFV